MEGLPKCIAEFVRKEKFGKMWQKKKHVFLHYATKSFDNLLFVSLNLFSKMPGNFCTIVVVIEWNAAKVVDLNDGVCLNRRMAPIFRCNGVQGK